MQFSEGAIGLRPRDIADRTHSRPERDFTKSNPIVKNASAKDLAGSWRKRAARKSRAQEHWNRAIKFQLISLGPPMPLGASRRSSWTSPGSRPEKNPP